ncbi:kinase-like domain-containing protein [Astrocystis sublimbata]|nr:kinase-like domain-containing protein [Astrocystis sublimbata]
MDILKNVACAIAHKLPLKLRGQDSPSEIPSLNEIPQVCVARLLAVGAFNTVWLVELHQALQIALSKNDSTCVRQFILRLPCDDALLPNQITNDVAFKQFVAKRLPHIPVPKVLLYHATDRADTSFSVEEYIDSPPLSSIWMSLPDGMKETLAQSLAKILVDISEVHFDMIGGLNPLNSSLAPTVEGCKIFKGRGQFHRDECYPVGPYRSTKEYILSCYDREIHYYSHATDNEIDADFFKNMSVPKFVEELKKKRQALSETEFEDEPFVLVHGDFTGRNILISGDQITAVLDWDFAGSFPISETLSGERIDVVEMESEETCEENFKWDAKIRVFIQDELAKRHWDQDRINLLMGGGNFELGFARCEMFPG